MWIEKEENNRWKIIINNKRKLLNNLSNCVEELENVCLSKYILKFGKYKF